MIAAAILVYSMVTVFPRICTLVRFQKWLFPTVKAYRLGLYNSFLSEWVRKCILKMAWLTEEKSTMRQIEYDVISVIIVQEKLLKVFLLLSTSCYYCGCTNHYY